MAFSFEDMTAAVEAYPAASVDLEIVDVVFSGSVINVNEAASFRVKVTNRGPLEMTGVTLRIKGLNGATVKQNGAAAPFLPEFVTTTSQLATIGAHGGAQTTNGSPFSFSAPGAPQPNHPLVQVTLEDHNFTLNHILNGHSDPLPSGPPKSFFSAPIEAL
jgi:hypothetical protein